MRAVQHLRADGQRSPRSGSAASGAESRDASGPLRSTINRPRHLNRGSVPPCPGVEIVELGDARFQFRSDFVAMEMSGEAAAEFVELGLAGLTEPRVVRRDRRRGWTATGRRASASSSTHWSPRASWSSAILQTTARRESARSTTCSTRSASGRRRRSRVSRARHVAVFGLEAHGAHVAAMLADAGVGTLTLVDPYPFEDAHRYLTPVHDPAAVGMSRQDALAARVRRDGLAIELPADAEDVDRDVVSDVVERCDLALACWDRGMSAAEHWVNQAAIDFGTPALFGELRATSCFAGPFVFPGAQRLPDVLPHANARLRNGLRVGDGVRGAPGSPAAHRPWPGDPVLPSLPTHLASILALEALAYLIRLNQPRLVDQVLEFDALQVATQVHPVLVEPGCPACGKKKSAPIPAVSSSA